MLKIRLFCLIYLNISATLEFYDMDGKITTPYEWCDQSDPIKAEEFKNALNKKYNEELSQYRKSESCSYPICREKVRFIVNCKEYRAYKEYQKSKTHEKIDQYLNMHIASFLIKVNEHIYPRNLEEHYQDAKKILLLSVFASMQHDLTKIPKIKEIKVNKSFPIISQLSFLGLHTDQMNIKHNSRDFYYDLPRCEKVCIKNELNYPVSMMVESNYLSDCCEFNGNFNFISSVRYNIKKILFSDDSSCKTLLVDSRYFPTVKSNAMIKIIQFDENTESFSDIKKYCEYIKQNDKYRKNCTNTPGFTDFMEALKDIRKDNGYNMAQFEFQKVREIFTKSDNKSA